MTTEKSTDASSPAGQSPAAWQPSATFRPPMVVTPTFGAPKPAAAAQKGETAAALLARLRRLHADGRVVIDVDLKRLTHMDSPVAFEAEINRWIYGLVLLTTALWYVLGYKFGLGTAAISLALYLSLGKMNVRRRIERRVRSKAMDDEAHWRELWSFGGVTLREVVDGGRCCAAPADSWMEFVRQLSAG